MVKKKVEKHKIPEGWNVKAVGDFANITSGGTPSTNVPEYWNGSIPWMNSGDLNRKRIFFVSGRITRKGLDNSSAKMIPAQCVLLGLAGQGKTRGTAAINYLPLAINQSVGAILPNRNFNSEFIYQFLDNAYDYIRDLSSGGGRGGISLALFKTIRCPFPPLYEQKDIADALSDMDCLISSTEKLISKKKAVKQGLMQELLTGKRRLPGFAKKWISLTLEELGHFKKGSGISREAANSGKLRAVRYGELYTLHEQYVKTYGTHISNEVASGALLVKRGDILFAASGETKEEIGKCAAIVDDGEIYAGGDIIVFSPRMKTDPIFLGSLLNLPYVNKQKSGKGQGDAVVHIHPKDLANIRIWMPSLPEQEEIAKILFATDEEIQNLSSKLQKLKNIKSGMMSELLSGRIRLLAISPNPGSQSGGVARTAANTRGHNAQFDDAVMISAIVNAFYSPKYPLGRKKIQKLLYLARRHQKASIEGFLKKAAGPYKPSARYSGGEKIAVSSRYISETTSDKGSVFAPGEKIQTALDYAAQWDLVSTVDWLLQNFKYTSVNNLEVLATVDMAICDLESDKDITLEKVREVILGNREWAPKLSKEFFSDVNILDKIELAKKLWS